MTRRIHSLKALTLPLWVWVMAVLAGLSAGYAWMESTFKSNASRQAFLETVPEVGRDGGYVSSDSCRACHPDEYHSWHQTYHRTMTQVAGTDSVVGRFDGQVLADDDFAYRLLQKDGGYFVEVHTFPVGVKPVLENPEIPSRLEGTYRVGLLTGSHHMQAYWLTGTEGNLQKLFPFTWLIHDERWVHRDDVFLRDPTITHGQQLWNQNCYRCHSTAAQPGLDVHTGLAHTRTAETGIGCEACHGPGEEHIRFYSSPLRRYRQRPNKNQEHVHASIVHPEKIDHRRSSEICGQCHSVKWFTDGPELWEKGFEYRPGMKLNDSTPVVQPTRLEDQPWLHPVLARNPDRLEKQFWPDGQVRVSGREFNGLIETPCYQTGTMSCLSCHGMHGTPPDDQLIPEMTGNRACTQCHESMAGTAALEAHTRHPADSAGSQCYNCHMPNTTYGLLKAMRSHTIDSPSVHRQLDSTRPNACSLCHLDKPLQWVSDSLSKWFAQEPAILDADMKSIPEGQRLALAGGPQQRALIAWHLGWDPALETGRPEWAPALLLELFSDRYAAIRYIAARSLPLWVPEETLHTLPELGYVAPLPERYNAAQSWKEITVPALDPVQAERLKALRPVNPVELGE